MEKFSIIKQSNQIDRFVNLNLAGKEFVSEFDIARNQAIEMLKELKAYKDAEESGLLLRLPCKFGTTIYWLNPNFERNDFEIEEMKFSIEMLCFIDWFGKYAFLTYEEAEAGLKALQEGE